MTNSEKIAALTMADVAAAKARHKRNLKTREGLDTIDFFLASVGETLNGRTWTLDDVKRELLRVVRD